MHERTQRAMARLMFVLCCAVPTFLTVGVLVVTWTPWYDQAVLRKITESIAKDTGFLIEIDDYDRPDPQRLELQNVRVVDPETHREVARVEHLTWTEVNDGVSIVLSHPRLQASELRGAWRLIHDRFLCSSICLSRKVRFAASDLTIQNEATLTTLQDVDAWIEPSADSTRANIECVRSGPRSSRRDGSGFRIEVVRDRSGDVPVTTWTMETSDTPLPCSALSGYSEWLDSLGSDAAFSGMVRWSRDADGWWIDLRSSRFHEVDLASLTHTLPHSLSGKASIAFSRGMIRPGKTIDIIGDVRADAGFVSPSLLWSLEQDLAMTVSANLNLEDPHPIAYEHLALHFGLQGSEMTLSGKCREAEGLEGLAAGVVFYGNGQSMVTSAGNSMPAVELTKLVAPSGSVLVPVSDKTSAMMQLLLAP